MTGYRTKGKGKTGKDRRRPGDGRLVQEGAGWEQMPEPKDASDSETAAFLERGKELVEIRFPEAFVANGGGLRAEEAQKLAQCFQGLSGPVRTWALRELLDRDPSKAVVFLESLLEMGVDLPEEVLDLAGSRPGENVARFLCRWHGLAKNKAFQKKLRRVLHKRKAQGLEVIEPERAEATEAVWKPPPVEAPHGLMSFPDGSGSRLVWVIKPLALRRVLAIGGLIQDTAGLKEVSILDLSRKESELYRRSLLEDGNLLMAETDPGYCAFRIEEAFRKGEPTDAKQKEAYLNIRPLLRDLAGETEPAHPAKAVACGDGDGEEGLDSEDPLGRGVELPAGGLLESWFLERERILPLADRYEEIQESRIIVHPLQKQERVSSFFREAARECFSDPACRLVWKTRLEDAAWVLLCRGRENEARKLCLAARHLSDPEGDPSRSPLLLHLVRKSLDAVLAQKKASADRTPSLIVKPGLGGR